MLQTEGSANHFPNTAFSFTNTFDGLFTRLRHKTNPKDLANVPLACHVVILWFALTFTTGKNQSAEKDDSYWEVTENLKSIVKAQEEELAFLAAERKRLMNKNFPKFPELSPEWVAQSVEQVVLFLMFFSGKYMYKLSCEYTWNCETYNNK